jgi:hypothetical protein
MSDIVERLRTADIYDYADVDKFCNEAADEIEKLRAAIKMAIECLEDRDVIGASLTLTKALGEKE